MKEERKTIPGFNGRYSVTNKGDIISEVSEKILSICDKQKAAYVTLTRPDGQRQAYRVHTLVANAFLTKPEDADCVIHINGDYLDNRVENLKWTTLAGKAKEQPYHENGVAAAAKARAKGIIQCDLKTGKPIKKFKSSSEAARIVFDDVSKNSLINRCAHGKRKEAYGYQWKIA